MLCHKLCHLQVFQFIFNFFFANNFHFSSFHFDPNWFSYKHFVSISNSSSCNVSFEMRIFENFFTGLFFNLMQSWNGNNVKFGVRDGSGQNPTRGVFSRTRAKFCKTRLTRSKFFLRNIANFLPDPAKIDWKMQKILTRAWPEGDPRKYSKPETRPEQNQKTRPTPSY